MGEKAYRVLIDGRMLLGRFSGVARVVTELVEQIACDSRFRPVILCGDTPYAPWVYRDDIELLLTDFRRVDRTPIRRYIWEATHLAGWVRASRTDVFHATWNSGVPVEISTPAVLTIHDLIPWDSPINGLRGYMQRACYRRSVLASARRAARVTTVSDYSRAAVLETLRIAPESVVTIHNGVTLPDGKIDEIQPPQSCGETPYVLYVGGHEERKNIAGLFRAMDAYWRRYGFDLALTLTGSTSQLCGSAQDAYRKLPPHAPVHFAGSPGDAELDILYTKARGFVILSTQEGFGLPALEAMAHSCPVVAAKCASLPEVVGDAGILVDPSKPSEVAGAIRQVASDADGRNRLITAGRSRARRFCWDVAAEKMLGIYADVVQASPARRAPSISHA